MSLFRAGPVTLSFLLACGPTREPAREPAAASTTVLVQAERPAPEPKPLLLATSPPEPEPVQPVTLAAPLRPRLSIAALEVASSSGVGEGTALQFRLNRDGCFRQERTAGVGDGSQEVSKGKGCTLPGQSAAWFAETEGLLESAPDEPEDAQRFGSFEATWVAADGSRHRVRNRNLDARAESFVQTVGALLVEPGAGPPTDRVQRVTVSSQRVDMPFDAFEGGLSSSGQWFCSRRKRPTRDIATSQIGGFMDRTVALKILGAFEQAFRPHPEDAAWATPAKGYQQVVELHRAGADRRADQRTLPELVRVFRAKLGGLDAICKDIP